MLLQERHSGVTAVHALSDVCAVCFGLTAVRVVYLNYASEPSSLLSLLSKGGEGEKEREGGSEENEDGATGNL